MVPQIDLWSDGICQGLASTGCQTFEGLTAESAPDVWSEQMRPLNRRAIALALVVPSFSVSALTYLTRPGRLFYDFYQRTRFAHDPLAYLEVLAVARLTEPPLAYSQSTLSMATGFFFHCTRPTSERSWASKAIVIGEELRMDRRLDEVVANWSRQHNAGLAFDTDYDSAHGGGGISLTIHMVTPHALFICHGLSSVWAFPVPTDKRRRAGMRLDAATMQRLLQGLDVELAHRPAEAIAGEGAGLNSGSTLSPSMCLGVADVIRQLLATSPQGTDARLRADALRYVQVFAGVRESMLDMANRQSQRAFDLEHLVVAIIAGGFLKAASGLQDSLLYSIRAAIQDTTVTAYYEQLLAQPHSQPGRTTQNEHRTSMHFAFCLEQQHWHARLLEDGQGVTRFGTIDATPEGGHEWEVAGFITVQNSMLADLFERAQFVTGVWVEGHAGDEDVQALLPECYAFLTEHLVIHQNPPAATGSGRGSLWHKCCTVLHSTKLTTTCWEHACLLMSSTFSWVGDLGTERLTPSFKANAKSMIGDWITKTGCPWDAPSAPSAPMFEAGGSSSSGSALFQVQRDDALSASCSATSMFTFEPEGGGGKPPASDPIAQADPYDVDLRRSVWISGMLHVVGNISEGLLVALPFFTPVVDQRREVCKLLSRKYSRTRLLNTSSLAQAWWTMLYCNDRGLWLRERRL